MKRTLLIFGSAVSIILSSLAAKANVGDNKYLWPPNYESGDTTSQDLKGSSFTTVDESDQFGEGE